MYNGVNQTPLNTSGVAGNAVSDQFPAGLRVLAVDHDPTCLRILKRMLESCHYKVTKCSGPEVALKLLREKKDAFDVVMSAVHMPEMDGFRLLKHIGSETNLPVIMMSADDRTSVVTKFVSQGACDYLIKPVRVESLRSIWQHVVRKRKHQYMKKDAVLLPGANMSPYGINSLQNIASVQAAIQKIMESKHLPGVMSNVSQYGNNDVRVSPRVDWAADLHQKFAPAVNKLETEKVELDKILETMNVPGVTRENVVSHLQKYRSSLKTPSDGPHQNGPILDPKQQHNDVNITIDSKHTFGKLKMNVHPQTGQQHHKIASNLPSYVGRPAANFFPLARNSEMACILGLLVLITLVIILQG